MYVVALLTPCLELLLTRRDRDFRGGWLRLLLPAVINTTTRGRQHVPTPSLKRNVTLYLATLEANRLKFVGFHRRSQSAAKFCHLEVPKSAAHPRLRPKSSIWTSKSSNTQALPTPGHTHARSGTTSRPCVDAFSPSSLSHCARSTTVQVARTSRAYLGR